MSSVDLGGVEEQIPRVGLGEREGRGHAGPEGWHSIWALLEHSPLLTDDFYGVAWD